MVYLQISYNVEDCFYTFPLLALDWFKKNVNIEDVYKIRLKKDDKV